jgi:hypothetical protein
LRVISLPYRFIAIHWLRVLSTPPRYLGLTKCIEGGNLGSQAQFTHANGDPPAMHLRKLVQGAVERSTAKAILLSGGLDTSIVCAAAAKQGRDLLAVSASVAGTVSPDEPYE